MTLRGTLSVTVVVVKDEAAVLRRYLDDGEDELMASRDGADEAEAAWSPAKGEWSILQCVEHVVLAEEYLLTRLESGRREPAEISPARADMILDRGADRTNRMESPEAGRPKGRFRTLAAAVAAFRAVRSRTKELIDRKEDCLRLLITDHPIIRGPVNCFEIVLMMSVHPKRHAAQIESIRESFARSRHALQVR